MTEFAHALAVLRRRLADPRPMGIAETPVAGVRMFWADCFAPYQPVVYDPGLAIIGQGHKIGHLGDRVFRYDPDSVLVVTVPMPIYCETHGSPEEPLLGLFVGIDLALLTELVDALGPLADGPAETALMAGIAPVPLDAEMRDAVTRLTGALASEREGRALGPGLVREVLYRALTGPHGATLRALTRADTRAARLDRAIRRIQSDYAEPLSVGALAAEAGLSISAFHRSFKALTSDTPLQYLKKVRLTRARSLIVYNEMRPGEAAFSVGYESASQFSREFKRYFQVAPSDARNGGGEL